MKPFFALVFSLVLLFCGCNENTPSTGPLANTDSEKLSGPSIRELTDERKLVKELLDVDAYLFGFSGTLLAVWLEAETKVEGEETIVRRIGPVSAERWSLKNDSPDSIRGKFIVSGNENSFFESPRLSISFKSESHGGGLTMSNPSPNCLAPPWPKNVPLYGKGFQWECPSELPDEGQEFTIASFNKKVVEMDNLLDPSWNWHDAKVLRETTIKIKGRRLLGAPEPTPEEKGAVTALRKAEASVYLHGHKGSFEGDPKTSARGLKFPYMRESFEKDTLIHLKQLAELESLDLNHTQITDDELVHLEHLSNLKELSLGQKVTTAGLKHLRDLTNLQELRIGPQVYSPVYERNPAQLPVADADPLANLTGLTNLEVLSLRFQDAKLTDGATEHIKELSNLRVLYLGPNEFTEKGLEQLKGLSKLEKLHFHSARSINAGLEHLKDLENLKDLGLYDTQITDIGLEHLKGLTSLQSLTIYGSGITDAELSKLRRALPRCKIRNKFGPHR